MKSKRQTVWLVSMLSLMVVLSAYYLFTEDGPQTKQVADGQQVTSMDQANNQETALGDSMIEGNEVILEEVTAEDGQDAAVVDEELLPEDTAVLPDPSATENEQAPAATDGKDTAKESGNAADTTDTSSALKDEDVLKQLETQGLSGADSLSAYQFQRSEENSRKTDELMQKINDGNSLDVAAMAQVELNALEEKEEKIFNIEEQLQQKYANAVVTETDETYKVVVVSEKLEAKEAVSIMDLVIKELGVSQDKVRVQYVTQ